MKIDEYNYDVVSIDLDSINQHFLDNEDNQGLKKLEQLSKDELQDIVFKVDDMFCTRDRNFGKILFMKYVKKLRRKNE